MIVVIYVLATAITSLSSPLEADDVELSNALQEFVRAAEDVDPEGLLEDVVQDDVVQEILDQDDVDQDDLVFYQDDLVEEFVRAAEDVNPEDLLEDGVQDDLEEELSRSIQMDDSTEIQREAGSGKNGKKNGKGGIGKAITKMMKKVGKKLKKVGKKIAGKIIGALQDVLGGANSMAKRLNDGDRSAICISHAFGC